MTSPFLKILTGVGSLLLLAVAGFHMTGLPLVTDVAPQIENSFMQKALAAIWTMPSVHWLFMAFLAFGMSFYKSNVGAALLIAFGLMVLIDAMLIFSSVGVFIGGLMLLGVGFCYLVAGLLLRREMKRA